MSLTRRFYHLLSGTEFGNLGPEMYVKAEGLKDYEGVVEDPSYYVGQAEKEVWKHCAAVVTAHVSPEEDTVEFGLGGPEDVRKTAATVLALGSHPRSRRHILHDYSPTAIAQALVTLEEMHEDQRVDGAQRIHAVGVQGDFWDGKPITDTKANGIAAGIPLGNLPLPLLRRAPTPELAAALRHLTDKLNGGCLLFTVDLKLPRYSTAFYLQCYRHPVHDRFNLSVLYRVVEETDIRGLDPRCFRREMLYNDRASQIAMLAVSDRTQKIIFEGTRFTIQAGEGLHINNVLKYSPRTLTQAIKQTGLEVCLYIRHATPLRLLGVIPRRVQPEPAALYARVDMVGYEPLRPLPSALPITARDRKAKAG